MMSNQPPNVAAEIEQLLLRAEISTEDDQLAVVSLLREGLDNPLDHDSLAARLDRIIAQVRNGAIHRNDHKTLAALTAHAPALRSRVLASAAPSVDDEGPAIKVALHAHNGIVPRAVFPTPVFHQHEIPMWSGFVNVKDIVLWDKNERLDVHVEQFERTWSRLPTGDELLQIMFSQMQLPGLEDEGDQFKIEALARSIASNGVQRPPVIDLDGTLLDGNRRLAACHWVLGSDEFTPEQKARAEKIFVWQLTEHADDQDRERVVVALNFEPDLKQEWPEYVKARRVSEEWQRILELEGHPGPKRAAELKRQLSQAFALGPNTTTVNRYIKMVALSDEFEEHQVVERGRDASAVKHAASRHFQYFDELQKGGNPGGVAHTLGQNDSLRHLVFDLLFQGKFRSWRVVRKLKFAADNSDVVAQLRDARDIEDVEEAQDKVDFALSLGETTSRESRELGANARIKVFAEWLSGLPLDSFAREQVTRDNVELLMSSFVLARTQAVPVLGEDRVQELTGWPC